MPTSPAHQLSTQQVRSVTFWSPAELRIDSYLDRLHEDTKSLLSQCVNIAFYLSIGEPSYHLKVHCFRAVTEIVLRSVSRYVYGCGVPL